MRAPSAGADAIAVGDVCEEAVASSAAGVSAEAGAGAGVGVELEPLAPAGPSAVADDESDAPRGAALSTTMVHGSRRAVMRV